jgi:hypothetical protein
LAVVRVQVRAALDRSAPGSVRAISVCAGQGHDLIGVLAGHPRRADVTARLVELDEHNALLARRVAKEAGLGEVEVVAADASMTDAYEGAVPADLVLLCGVFGNISAEDIANTVSHLPRLCAPEAKVIWTRHRHPPDLTPYIRETFERAGFVSLLSRIRRRSASEPTACLPHRCPLRAVSAYSSSLAMTFSSRTSMRT